MGHIKKIKNKDGSAWWAPQAILSATWRAVIGQSEWGPKITSYKIRLPIRIRNLKFTQIFIFSRAFPNPPFFFIFLNPPSPPTLPMAAVHGLKEGEGAGVKITAPSCPEHFHAKAAAGGRGSRQKLAGKENERSLSRGRLRSSSALERPVQSGVASPGIRDLAKEGCNSLRGGLSLTSAASTKSNNADLSRYALFISDLRSDRGPVAVVWISGWWGWRRRVRVDRNGIVLVLFWMGRMIRNLCMVQRVRRCLKVLLPWNWSRKIW